MDAFINQFPKRIIWLLVVGLLMGCTTHTQNPGTTAMQKIEGSVWYRERMLLPNAEVHVALEDVARMDVAADVIASTRFTPQGGPPWDFSIAYDPARINDKGRYALRARIEVDGRLIFINTTHIPAFNHDPGTPVRIMVSRVGKAASQMKPDAELVNTYWKLSELNSKSVKLGVEKKEVHMVFANEKNQVQGFSGCNRFSGTYQQKTNQLKFGPMAATMMACVDGMAQEAAFLKALGKVTRYTIAEDTLSLYSGEQKLILRFEAVYLK